MRGWVALAAGAIVALVLVFTLAGLAGSRADVVRAVGSGVVVIAGALGSYTMRRHSESVTGSDAPGSLQRRVATGVQARVYIDTLMVAAAALVASPFTTWPATALVVAVLAISVLDFWVRYGLALRREKSRRPE